MIELLVVVAIVAILAAVAIPNFLEAQVRAKVSRVREDFHALTLGLESYQIDNRAYPPHGELLADGTLNDPAVHAGLGTVEFLPPSWLTTPTGYLEAVPLDPFMDPRLSHAAAGYGYIQSRLMASILLGRGLTASAQAIEPAYGRWRLYSAGPDGDKGADAKVNRPYDPSNGTISNGDLIRSQREIVMTRTQDER